MVFSAYVHRHGRRLLGDDAAERRETVALDLRLGIPQFRAHQRLAAMEIAFVDSTLRPIVGTTFCTASGVSSAGSWVISALPLMRSVSLMPGTMKMRPTPGEARMLPNVSTRLLPRRSGISSDLVVEHGDEARPVAARAGIGVALAVARREHEERGERDEVATELVEMVQHLLLGERADLPEMPTQVVRRLDQGLSARTAAFHGKPPPVSFLCLRFLDPAPAGDEQGQRLGDLLDGFDVRPAHRSREHFPSLAPKQKAGTS